MQALGTNATILNAEQHHTSKKRLQPIMPLAYTDQKITNVKNFHTHIINPHTPPTEKKTNGKEAELLFPQEVYQSMCPEHMF
jgi:hypothetical protein